MRMKEKVGNIIRKRVDEKIGEMKYVRKKNERKEDRIEDAKIILDIGRSEKMGKK
jgi:hypothetical protein